MKSNVSKEGLIGVFYNMILNPSIGFFCNNPTANVENMDFAVGMIMDCLNRNKVAENTLVIFTSDNGPETLNRYGGAWRSHGSPGFLKGMKLHTHEAGIRVPGVMRWPLQIKAGQVS